MTAQSSSLDPLSKHTALPWFETTLRESELLERSAIYQAFDFAWKHAENAIAERWRAWVRQAVQQAKTRGDKNPGGLLITLFKAGPTADLTKQATAASQSPAEYRARQTREYLAEQKRLAAELPFAGKDTRPPLSYALRATREGRDPQEIYDAWAAAGYPAPNAFPYPLTKELERA